MQIKPAPAQLRRAGLFFNIFGLGWYIRASYC